MKQLIHEKIQEAAHKQNDAKGNPMIVNYYAGKISAYYEIQNMLDDEGAVLPLKGLTFTQLREANKKRLPLFKNCHGEIAHDKPDGSDWSPAQWLQAVIGELGEYANFRKKYERGDISFETFGENAARELADVQTYLDILAQRCLDINGLAHHHGINLGEATRVKFNDVSDRVGCDVKL